MTCQQVLASYTEYLDSALPAEMRERLEVHLARCESCARYERVLSQGLRLVRELPELAASPDFEQRLQHGIYHVRDERVRRTRLGPTSGAALLAVAGLVALATWGPLGNQDVATLPALTAGVEVRADESPSIGGTDAWFVGVPAVYMDPDAPPSLSLAFPGPYSPLVVEPPLPSAAGVQFTSFRVE